MDQISKGAPPMSKLTTSQSINHTGSRAKEYASGSGSVGSWSVNPHRPTDARYKHLQQVQNNDLDFYRQRRDIEKKQERDKVIVQGMMPDDTPNLSDEEIVTEYRNSEDILQQYVTGMSTKMIFFNL